MILRRRADAVKGAPRAAKRSRRGRRAFSPAMRQAFRLRRLTDGERALAQDVFGAGLDLRRTAILAAPLWPRAFVAGARLIVWPARALPADFAAAPLGLQAAFVHELAHVWQAQRGVFLPLAKLRAGDSARAYAYALAEETDFAALNIEQQAMVVEHAFLAARGAVAPYPPHVYARLQAAWRDV